MSCNLIAMVVLASLPAPAGPAHGFGLPGVALLHDWRAERAGEQFGWVARNAGDVDGDGAADVIASAPFHLEGGAQAGRVVVRSGKSGALLFEKRGAGAQQLGFTVCELGERDGDGFSTALGAGASTCTRERAVRGWPRRAPSPPARAWAAATPART